MTQLTQQTEQMNIDEVSYTMEAIFNIPEINGIIMGYKKEIDMVNDKILLNSWISRKRTLRQAFEEAENNVEHLRKRIKNNCNHTDITEHIEDGYERSSHTYTCNQCHSNVTMWDDFSYKHITNKIDYRS